MLCAQKKGNAAFAAGNHEEAIEHFSEGIKVDPGNHVLYSNRSASLVRLMFFSLVNLCQRMPLPLGANMQIQWSVLLMPKAVCSCGEDLFISSLA